MYWSNARWLWVRAVSYTHLDVYKRQPQAGWTDGASAAKRPLRPNLRRPLNLRVGYWPAKSGQPGRVGVDSRYSIHESERLQAPVLIASIATLNVAKKGSEGFPVRVAGRCA